MCVEQIATGDSMLIFTNNANNFSSSWNTRFKTDAFTDNVVPKLTSRLGTVGHNRKLKVIIRKYLPSKISNVNISSLISSHSAIDRYLQLSFSLGEKSLQPSEVK